MLSSIGRSIVMLFTGLASWFSVFARVGNSADIATRALEEHAADYYDNTRIKRHQAFQATQAKLKELGLEPLQMTSIDAILAPAATQQQAALPSSS